VSVDGFQTVWVNIACSGRSSQRVVTSIGTVLHVVLASFAGYVLIQRNLPGRRLMIGVILATMAIPGELIMIPLFHRQQATRAAHTPSRRSSSRGSCRGFSILLMRNLLRGGAIRSCRVGADGRAGDFHIFRTIYLPLSQAGLARSRCSSWFGRWNQFLPVILYISDSSKYTLQVALQALVTENMGTSGTAMVTPNVRMAGIVIAILPLGGSSTPFMQRLLRPRHHPRLP